MKSLKIVFMGTPEFAVPMLDILVKSTHEIVGVITAPDKPAGRGMELQESAVKQFAKQHGLHIMQPEKLKNEDFLNGLSALEADLFIIVAFRMLPEVVWTMPPLGSINLHASLLPDYRGAAPINWAIINGEKETGVTTFFLQHEIDTGNIIFQEKIAIGADENAGTLYEKLMHLGAKILRQTVDAVALGDYPQIPQAHITEVKHAPKIFKETCRIDWNKTATEVHNFVRGLSPYPTAFTTLGGKSLKVFKATAVKSQHDSPSGMIMTDGKTSLKIACAAGYLELLEIQLEGKKKIGIQEFLRGYKNTETSVG
jgi:methionyl-tRNA formyltransferase